MSVSSMGGNVEIRGPGWATASGGGRLKKPQDARAKGTKEPSEPERKQEKALAVTSLAAHVQTLAHNQPLGKRHIPLCRM